jgi:hypothetical protein
MRHTTATTIDEFYDAWNGHDAPAVTASFASSGAYSDPLTCTELSGSDLTDHVHDVLDVIRDLRITVDRTIPDDEAAVAAWTIEGTSGAHSAG